jgi:hypothetical protein
MHIQLRHIASVLLLGAACLPLGPARAAHATVGIGTAANCTEAALDAALVAGGEIIFNCGGSTTIALSSEKLIAKNTAIDGANQVTLSGQGARRIFKTNNQRCVHDQEPDARRRLHQRPGWRDRGRVLEHPHRDSQHLQE